jgi:hypothetical protein
VELIDSKLKGAPAYTNKEMKEFALIGREFVDLCQVRD